jgi:predicted dehydrogenase
LGILGCGNVTEKKKRTHQKNSQFEIAAGDEETKTKHKITLKRHGIEKYYTDTDALINDPEIDTIYIATPPDTHKLYGTKVAEAGKICCIEKPLTQATKRQQYHI